MSLALVSVGALFIDLEIAKGVLAGGVVMGANFWLMRFLIFKAIGGPKPNTAYALALVLKFSVVMGLIWVMVSLLKLHPVGIACGLLTLFVGIGLGMMHTLFEPTKTT